MDTLLSTASASRILGITVPTLISYVDSGKIPASFIAQKFRFKSEDLVQFVESSKRQAK